MSAPNALRQYQQQAVLSASPEILIDKLYGIGVSAAHAGDASRTQRVLVELMSALDRERGGEIAERLLGLYEFSIRAASRGDLEVVAEILEGLRDAWRDAMRAPVAIAA
ncbi:flagellar export chaperone FliS [Rubrivirga sp.]|uniref:flagellar export chaperone FliS n=1 Tax=Rubrivirga sp. TaxID=1885344 RepID=UPI003C7598BE